MGLMASMQSDRVSDLNLRKAICVSPDSPLKECIHQMREGKLGCAIVVDENQKPLGLFTEAMVRHLLCNGDLSFDQPIEKHMADTFAWVRASDTVDLVLDALEAKNIRYVVVVNDADEVVGLTGQKGLMEYIADHFPQEVHVQRIGTHPYPATREGA